jgi:hypothetical protein
MVTTKAIMTGTSQAQRHWPINFSHMKLAVPMDNATHVAKIWTILACVILSVVRGSGCNMPYIDVDVAEALTEINALVDKPLKVDMPSYGGTAYLMHPESNNVIAVVAKENVVNVLWTIHRYMLYAVRNENAKRHV